MNAENLLKTFKTFPEIEKKTKKKKLARPIKESSLRSVLLKISLFEQIVSLISVNSPEVMNFEKLHRP